MNVQLNEWRTSIPIHALELMLPDLASLFGKDTHLCLWLDIQSPRFAPNPGVRLSDVSTAYAHTALDDLLKFVAIFSRPLRDSRRVPLSTKTYIKVLIRSSLLRYFEDGKHLSDSTFCLDHIWTTSDLSLIASKHMATDSDASIVAAIGEEKHSNIFDFHHGDFGDSFLEKTLGGLTRSPRIASAIGRFAAGYLKQSWEISSLSDADWEAIAIELFHNHVRIDAHWTSSKMSRNNVRDHVELHIGSRPKVSYNLARKPGKFVCRSIRHEAKPIDLDNPTAHNIRSNIELSPRHPCYIKTVEGESLFQKKNHSYYVITSVA